MSGWLGGIYSDGVAAPAPAPHGSHSSTASIFILAFQECQWSDVLVTSLTIHNPYTGRHHGAETTGGPNNLTEPMARAGTHNLPFERKGSSFFGANKIGQYKYVAQKSKKK